MKKKENEKTNKNERKTTDTKKKSVLKKFSL